MLGIYVVTNLPYSQKRWLICSLLSVTLLVHFEGFEWFTPWKFGVVVLIDQKPKTKKTKQNKTKRKEQYRGTKFSCIRGAGEER